MIRSYNLPDNWNFNGSLGPPGLVVPMIEIEILFVIEGKRRPRFKKPAVIVSHGRVKQFNTATANNVKKSLLFYCFLYSLEGSLKSEKQRWFSYIVKMSGTRHS
jgi:hypothetical protein